MAGPPPSDEAERSPADIDLSDPDSAQDAGQHETDTGSETVRTDVGVLHLPSGDTVMLLWLRAYGSFETPESAIIDELLGAGGTFVDIGAHVGYHTIRALRRVGPHGAVIAVEPWARVRELLIRNVRSNLGQAGVNALTLVADAAWYVAEPLVLHPAYEVNSGDSRVYRAGTGGAAGRGVQIRGVRLDDLAVLATRRVDMVKVDTQGADHRALTGMIGVLRRDHPTVLCEFCPPLIQDIGDDPEAVLACYQSWGYLVEPVCNPDPGYQWSSADLMQFVQSAADSFVTLRLRPIQGSESGDSNR